MSTRPSEDQLRTAVRRAMAKFHPDRNRPDRVGEERAVRCEEICKVASLLQTLFDEANLIDLYVMAQEPCKLRVDVRTKVRDLQLRVAEETGVAGAVKVKLRGGPVLIDHGKSLHDYGVQHNAQLEVIAEGWETFEG